MRHLAVIPLLVLVAGCASGNSHVGSHFDCRAPGGTCAPMSVIDARAVAGLGDTQPVATRSRARPQPSGHSVPIANATTSAPPLRTSERVLRIVFPAHIDADGVYRDESTAHAVVEGGEWVDALTGPVALRASGPTQGAASTAAPEKSALATLDEVIASRAARPGPSAAPAPSQVPAIPQILQGTPSRSLLPQSLAETAAGLSAPGIATLDGQESPARYDRPDVPAVAMPDPAAGGAIQPAPAATATKAIVAAPVPAPATTAALNSAELEKVRRPGFASAPPTAVSGGRAAKVEPLAQAKP